MTSVRVRLDRRAIESELSAGGSMGRMMRSYESSVTKDIKSVFKNRTGGAWWPLESRIVEKNRGARDRRALILTVTVRRSRPHTIIARNAPALVFYWERAGRMFVGQQVNHPGSTPPVKLILSGIEKAGRRITFTRAAPTVRNT